MKRLLSLVLVVVIITSLFSIPLFASDTASRSYASAEEMMNASEILTELIYKGKERIEGSDEKNYADGKSALSHLNNSLEYAQSSHNESHHTVGNIVMLKRAIANLDSRKYMAEEALVPLKIVEERLSDYKSKYYDFLNESKKIELDELIQLIKSYTDESSDAKLTKGVFDGIMRRENAFNDPVVVLAVVLTSARILLFKDPNDPSKGYLYDRDDTRSQAPPGV